VRLLKFELENILAYDRKVELDLDVVTPEKNIILIWGRNGMGKTSFLNALKLVFYGAEGPERIRKVGFPPRTLTPKQYVLGDGGAWTGLLNSRVRHRAAAAGEQVTARVRLQWRTSDRITVTAERQWTEVPGGYKQHLYLWDGEQRLTGEPAELRLQDFMPLDYVDFFFFDGEEIKHLAESDERKSLDFDKLLRISFLATLRDQLKDVARERTRTGAADTLRLEIARKEELLTQARLTLEADGQRVAELDSRIATAQVELRRLTTRREDLSAGASDAQRSALEARLRHLQDDLRDEEGRLADTLPVIAPFTANLALVELAVRELNERTKAAGTAEQALAVRIRTALPGWLTEKPLLLHQSFAKAVAEEVTRRIDEMVAPAAAPGIFMATEQPLAQRIQRRLEAVLLRGTEDRDDAIRRLAIIRRLRRDIEQGRTELLELQVGSQANLEEYRRIDARITELESVVGDWRELRGELAARLRDAQTAEKQLVAQLKDLRVKQEVELRSNNQSLYILRLAAICEDLRSEVRKSARRLVEALINERFDGLVHGNEMLTQVEIADDYTLSFRGPSGDLIGRSSLSSGIKQLAATAFLWAMKDAVGEDRPVVIDTPLGRLDRENQDRMLNYYYPKLSSQVIVLPTNTELDRSKLEQLRPHVAQEFRIDNPSREGANILKGSLIDEVAP
jgi:DNA sulfur modification protein DndD